MNEADSSLDVVALDAIHELGINVLPFVVGE
jgi:hypothetical protein